MKLKELIRRICRGFRGPGAKGAGPPPPEDGQGIRLTLVDHLSELRRRIVVSLIAVAAGSLLCYLVSRQIMDYLARPVGSLVFIAPHEAFLTSIKIAVLGGVLLSSPFVLFQAWRFVAAGLKRGERARALAFMPVSFGLVAAGTAFGYFIVLPIGMKFLLGFATDSLAPMISIGRYVSFVARLIIAFGVMFQLPLVSLFLTKVGVVTPTFLAKRRKQAIILVFIVAAVLTPPDVLTQGLLALPLIVLYEVGVLLSKVAYRRRG